MTIQELRSLQQTKTTEEIVIGLIKKKDPSVKKLGKGRYEIRDEDGNPIIRTKGLRV